RLRRSRPGTGRDPGRARSDDPRPPGAGPPHPDLAVLPGLDPVADRGGARRHADAGLAAAVAHPQRHAPAPDRGVGGFLPLRLDPDRKACSPDQWELMLREKGPGMSGTDELEREESERERINRNWHELLQELRVTQVGVQILTAFLLMLPFQRRFVEISETQRTVYLVIVCFAAAATGLIIAPVSYHRMVFRRRQKPWLVRAAHLASQLGLICLA